MMLTINLSVENGICNGTRVQIISFKKNTIKVRLLTGKKTGQEIDLFRITFKFGGDPEQKQEGFIPCERVQFPLRPGMAMTINKSQGIFCNYNI